MTFVLVIGAIILAVCSVIVLGIMRREMKRENENDIREMELKFNRKKRK